MYFLHFSPFTKSDLSFLTIRGMISKFESYTVRNRKGEGEGKGRPVLLFSRSPPPPSPIRTATQAQFGYIIWSSDTEVGFPALVGRTIPPSIRMEGVLPCPPLPGSQHFFRNKHKVNAVQSDEAKYIRGFSGADKAKELRKRDSWTQLLQQSNELGAHRLGTISN